MNPNEFAAVLILTSNPIDFIVKKFGVVSTIDHVLTGGILDMFILGKGTAR